MNYPILCLTKGRADTKLAKTIVQISEAPAEFRSQCHIVVEPQDVDAYRKVFPAVGQLVLPQNDPGLPFARQWALEWAESAGTPFWMLDDDISAFGLVRGGRVVKTPMADVFEVANELLGLTDDALGPERILGQAALEYQQFAWSAKTDVNWRGYCDVAVWINAPALRGQMRYHPDRALKEDRDFTLQVLAAGCETARLSRIAFAAPKNGSNAGGLKRLYDLQGREAEAVDRMVKGWPGIVTKVLKPDGRIDCKIDWKRAFTPR